MKERSSDLQDYLFVKILFLKIDFIDNLRYVDNFIKNFLLKIKNKKMGTKTVIFIFI